MVKERTKEQTYAAYGILVFSLCIVVAVVLLGYSAISYARALAEYNSSVQQMNNLQVVKSVYDKHQEIVDLQVQVNEMYAVTETNNENINDFIVEMEEKMPKDIIVLSMSGTASDISMQLEVESKEAAAKVIQQFRAFDSVEGVSVTGIQSELDEDLGTESISFNVVIKYAPKKAE